MGLWFGAENGRGWRIMGARRVGEASFVDEKWLTCESTLNWIKQLVPLGQYCLPRLVAALPGLRGYGLLPFTWRLLAGDWTWKSLQGVQPFPMLGLCFCMCRQTNHLFTFHLLARVARDWNGNALSQSMHQSRQWEGEHGSNRRRTSHRLFRTCISIALMAKPRTHTLPASRSAAATIQSCLLPANVWVFENPLYSSLLSLALGTCHFVPLWTQSWLVTWS